MAANACEGGRGGGGEGERTNRLGLGQQLLPRLLKAGNPFPLRSAFFTFPTDRKFEFKLEIIGNRRY